MFFVYKSRCILQIIIIIEGAIDGNRRDYFSASVNKTDSYKLWIGQITEVARATVDADIDIALTPATHAI